MKKSIWQKTLITKTISSLKRKEEEFDIAIIGGGITGVTTAALLKESNYKVAVLEANTIASSNSGKSTGNLYTLLDTPLQTLAQKYSHELISLVLQSRQEALELIERLIDEYNINCSFKKVPWVLYAANEDMNEFIKKEFQLAKELNLNPQWLDEESPNLRILHSRCGFEIPSQAQFNPYSYVNELAEKIHSKNIHIFENTRVTNINRDEDGHILTTQNSQTIYAKKIIHATHTPLGVSHLQTVVAPYREYGLAHPLSRDFDDGIYWGYEGPDEVISIRKHIMDDQKYVIAVGAPHKVGQGEGEESLGFLREKLENLEIIKNEGEYIEWSGQHFRSTDYLPFIGEGFERNTLLCTGFATDGLIYGTLSALIFKDILLKQKNPYQDLYRPHRLTSIGSKTFIKENLNVLEQYIFDYLKSNETEHPEKGKGKIISYHGNKLAVSKDLSGELQICSAICPHMGCVVHWNDTEMSWDCPCHGSRFTNRGKVIEGPSLKNLLEDQKEES